MSCQKGASIAMMVLFRTHDIVYIHRHQCDLNYFMCYIRYCSLILINMFILKHECTAHYEWNAMCVGPVSRIWMTHACGHAENSGQDLC
jgi:hypothetical protein